MMKKIMMLAALTAFCAAGAVAQITTTTTLSGNQAVKPATAKAVKTAKTTKTLPTSDADIQQCIVTKLAKAPKLSKDGIESTVSGSVATLTGNVPDPGSKGGAGSLAKSCGAKSVVNNINFTAKPKTAKPVKKPVDKVNNAPNNNKPATTNAPPSK